MTRTHIIRRADRMNLETEAAPATTPTYSDNFLAHLQNMENLGADERLELTKVTCNALTNQVMWALMSHSNAQRRAEERAEAASLDERNERDESERGQALSDHLTDASGFDVTTPPLKIAAICDGIRVHLYDELHSLFELDEADDVLYSDPGYTSTDPKRYRTPMALESLLKFWAELRSDIAPNDRQRLDIVKSRFPEQYERALDDAKQRARREAARFRETARDVMAEARSFTEAYDVDAFTALPLSTQIQIAERIQDKLLARAAKLLTNTQMDINEAISISTAMHGIALHAKAWLNQPKILQIRDILTAMKNAKQSGRKPEAATAAPTLSDMADDLPA